MKTLLFPANARGKKDAGWLKSNFVFSFSDFCDPQKSAFGTLVAFNDDFLEPGKGFGVHPHINMEIISVMLSGRMNHKDSMGYTTVVEAGGVQIMSAGSGLKHEEYNVGTDTVNFLQIWIQPKQQNIIPRYQQRSFPKENCQNQLYPIVSHAEGQGHCWINQNTTISLGNFQGASKVPYNFNPQNMCLFIFVMDGSLKIGGQYLATRDAIGIWDCGQIELDCADSAYFLLLETPINQK